MTRRGIWVGMLAILVLLAAGASQTLAGKGGNKGGGNGGGGSEPPADPAIAVVNNYGSGPGVLRVVNEDGSNVTELLTADEVGGNDIGSPDWSPDGTQLVFTAIPTDGTSTIHLINADGTGLTQIHEGNSLANGWNRVRWSPGPMPDGIERIAYVDQSVLADGSLGPHNVFLMETDGSNPIDTGRNAGHMSWSPDATRLAVNKRTNGLRVLEFDVDGTGTLVLADAPRYDLDADVVNVAWSKTDNNVLAVTVHSPSNFLEIWQVDLRNGVVSGSNSDGTLLFSLTTHEFLADAEHHRCDWSSDDSRLIFESGEPKRNGGLRYFGAWIVGVDPYVSPELFHVMGFMPAWRR